MDAEAVAQQTMSADDRTALEALDRRLKTILPNEYQDSYESVQPVSMGSAGLKYGFDGKVAWNEIWGSFCDLAMAGGPPHKGKLLAPGTPEAIDAQPARYEEVTDEIARGIWMTTDLDATLSATPGWMRVACYNEGMAGWLLRAIAMENVAVRGEGKTIELPAAPHFRLEKEIKNVITVIAKTCHYWLGHMPAKQQKAIASLFAKMAEESPLVTPALSASGSPEWRGVECASVTAAVWLMRALVASNVLARREDTTLFVPVNPAIDPGGAIVSAALARVRHLAAIKGIA